MSLFRVTTKQAIGNGKGIPAGASVEISIHYSSTRPSVHEVKNAFEAKYGIPVSTGELCMLDYQKLS